MGGLMAVTLIGIIVIPRCSCCVTGTVYSKITSCWAVPELSGSTRSQQQLWFRNNFSPIYCQSV